MVKNLLFVAFIAQISHYGNLPFKIPLRASLVEAVHPVQMGINQSNTYREDLAWLHFCDWPGFEEAASEGITTLHTHFSSLSNISKKHLGAQAQT